MASLAVWALPVMLQSAENPSLHAWGMTGLSCVQKVRCCVVCSCMCYMMCTEHRMVDWGRRQGQALSPYLAELE